MKVLKRIGLGILTLIGLVLITALFVKRDMRAEREIVIAKPKDQVYGYVQYLKNQNEYSKWARMDPAMQKSFRGTDGTVGFISAWKSEKSEVGEGEQEIKAMKPGGQIDYQIRFKEPFESVAASSMITEAVDANRTKVKWTFDSKMMYPMNIMGLLYDMDGLIGSDLDEGLRNLKANLEKK